MQKQHDFKKSLMEVTSKQMGQSLEDVSKAFREMNNQLAGHWINDKGPWFRFGLNDRYEFGGGASTVVGIYQAIGENLFLYSELSGSTTSFALKQSGDTLTLTDGKSNRSIVLYRKENQSAVLNKMGNTIGNINNFGIVAAQNDWIYFLGAYKDKIDGIEFKQINTEQGTHLNVIGDWLYYCNFDGRNICKVNIDGKTPFQKLNSDQCSDVIVADDWIYYTNRKDGAKIYRVDTDGNNREKINNDRSGFINVVGDWIYYAHLDEGIKPYGEDGAGHLYKIRKDGSSRTKLCEDSCKDVSVINDWIYYGNASKSHTLWKIDINGKNRERVLTDIGGGYNIVGDWVYFTSAENGYSILKCRLDGTGRQRLNQDHCIFVNVVGEWIYYVIGPSFSGPIYKMRTDGTERKLLT